MTLRDSDDKVIHDTRPDIKTGSKWSVSDTVSDVESQLKHKDIGGAIQVDRRESTHSELIWWSSAADRQKTYLVAFEV